MDTKVIRDISIYTITAVFAVVGLFWFQSRAISLATEFPSELHAIAVQIENGGISLPQEKVVGYLKAAAKRDVEVTIIHGYTKVALSILAAGYLTISCLLIQHSRLTRRLSPASPARDAASGAP